MDLIETVAMVVLGWTMLSLAMGVAWARFFGRVQHMEAALARDRAVRLATLAGHRQSDAAFSRAA